MCVFVCEIFRMVEGMRIAMCRKGCLKAWVGELIWSYVHMQQDLDMMLGCVHECVCIRACVHILVPTWSWLSMLFLLLLSSCS